MSDQNCLVTKRHRRPSVRLADPGDGNLISTSFFDSLLPRQHRPSKKTKPAHSPNYIHNNGSSKKVLKKKPGNQESIEGEVNEENIGGDLDGEGEGKARVSVSKVVDEEDEGDLDGVAIGSWKARVLASRGGRKGVAIRGSGLRGSSGKRGGVSNVGSKLVEDRNDEDVLENEGDLDGVAIASWKGRGEEVRGSDGKRGGMHNLGSKLVCENQNESGDRNFEPIHLEEEDREENRDDSDSDDGDGDGNADINGVEKGRNGKDLRFQVSDGTDDPSDLSERNGVKVWLKKLGLQRYALNFEVHEVDDEVLPLLTLEDLKDIGITAVGSRRKMFCSIQNLNN